MLIAFMATGMLKDRVNASTWYASVVLVDLDAVANFTSKVCFRCSRESEPMVMDIWERHLFH